MPTKKTKVAVVSALDRVLDALGEELVEATDEEILEAARDLGMDPKMRGSAAFLGLKYPFLRHPRDFFAGFDLKGRLPAPAVRIEDASDGSAGPADEAETTDESMKRGKKPTGH